MSKTIFVSYSHKDLGIVSKLVESIQKKVDCDIWFDKNLHGGEEYFGVIADKILECEYFLFIVSPNSVIANWCIKELEFAMNENKKIIAVWLEEFKPPARVRLVISNTHYIRSYELDEDDFAKNIAEALSAKHYELSRGEAEYQISEQQASGGKYFIYAEEKEKIEKLLNAEKRQDFITCFESENAVLLGLAYEIGVGIKKDKDKADFYYHIAAYKGNLDGEYLMLAMGLANNTVNRAQTVARMNELAEAGCMKALVYWGDEVYLGNWNMKSDKATAYRWFKRAADIGDPAAKYFLGFGYRTGELDGKPDYIIAWMYFQEAAQQGFPRAYRQIAFMYKKGQMVEQNLETARQYYMKAVECGDKVAYTYIGNLERDAKNYEAAFEFYKKAADFVEENDYTNGTPFYSIAWAYEYGEGVEKSSEMAIEYYFKAVAKNHKASIKRVAMTIYFDIEEKTRKLELLEKAREQNCTNAEYYLGLLYEDKQEVDTALFYYEAGADKGYLDCMESLNSFYSWIFGAKEYANRHKALANFSLYFSLLNHPDNEQFFEKRKKSYLLQQFYYVYAAELDIDVENHMPDHTLAMHYYKKCLECDKNYKHWPKMLSIACDYLSGKYKTVDRANDIDHAIELIKLCDDFFDDVYKKGNEEKIHNDLKQTLIKTYEMLIEKISNNFMYYGKIIGIKQRFEELKTLED